MPRIKVRDAKSGQIVVLDQIRQPLFDTVKIDDGSTINETKEFFSSVQGKKEYETNLRQNNLLEQAVSFRVQGLAIDAHTVSDDDGTLSNSLFLAKFMENTGLKLRIGEKVYWEGPMRFATGRVCTSHQKDGSAAPQVFNYSQYGACAVAGIILAGKDSIDIPPLQSFRVKMETADLAGITVKANNAINFVCSLKGLLRRPVQ